MARFRDFARLSSMTRSTKDAPRLAPDAPNFADDAPAASVQATGKRPLRVLLVAGSQRRLHSCPGLDSKARALMHRMIGKLPAGWQVDHEDIGNEHGKPKIQ